MSFWKCFSCLRFPTDESITILDYTNGTLTDIPPDIHQFERTLEELYLSSNRISDLSPELFYCQGIRTLKINDNEIETIPNSIGSLKQLQILDLSRNALTYMPDSIKSCKHLTHLDLSLNNLQRLPDAITNLISLQELLLNETYLEFLPANFGRLVNLKILELRSNNLITLPKSMARLSDLIRIDIGANEFTELPEVIGQLTQLRELWIDYNRIRRISTNISNLRELIHFEANSNQLRSLPNEISYWRNLEVLSLSTNDLESLPFSIGMLKRLVTLKCDSNQLRELPDSICHLESLEEMMINHNYIMNLPNTIGLLRKMRFLAADGNLLRRLPNEICSCISLSVLSLRGNQLTELPQDIGHLINLRVLNIVKNAITYLPVSILNLTQLTALWISDNQSQPLVPLQYCDSVTKAQLTCFMLPQVTAEKDNQKNGDYQKAQLNQEYGDNGSVNSWIILQQQQQQQQNRNHLSIIHHNNSSPSRRICFADESTIKPNDTVSSRLMRSPTPYPKELRLMAKYAKNMNSYRDTVEMIPPQQTEQHENNMDDIQANLQIKEARVLSNSIGSKYSTTEHHDEKNNCDISDVQTKLIDTNERYFYDTLKIVNNNRDQYLNTHNHQNSITNSHDTYDGISPTVFQQHQQQYQSYRGYNKLGSPYNNILYSQELDWKGSNYNIGPSISPSSLQNSIDKSEYVQRQPPPYHIAKAFTKKSREDLLNYDSVRNQTELNNDVRLEYDDKDNILIKNHINDIDTNFNTTFVEQNGNNDYNNEYNGYIQKKEGDLSETLYFPMINSSRLSRASSSNMTDINRDMDENNLMENHQRNTNDYDEAENQKKIVTQIPGRSSKWLFGRHTNPTVKQLLIKKEPLLGFEIKEVYNQGIFVSTTMCNTSAGLLLRANDKVLDVDGVDFSKLSLQEAKEVLVNSGPTLNIMISRK